MFLLGHPLVAEWSQNPDFELVRHYSQEERKKLGFLGRSRQDMVCSIIFKSNTYYSFSFCHLLEERLSLYILSTKISHDLLLESKRKQNLWLDLFWKES
jgi:hypothetical protein